MWHRPVGRSVVRQLCNSSDDRLTDGPLWVSAHYRHEASRDERPLVGRREFSSAAARPTQRRHTARCLLVAITWPLVCRWVSSRHLATPPRYERPSEQRQDANQLVITPTPPQTLLISSSDHRPTDGGRASKRHFTFDLIVPLQRLLISYTVSRL